MSTERYELNKQLAQMLKGGVIMDVTTPEQAKIAEEAGACAVMALERIPADIRAAGGVSRMSDPKMIKGIQEAVSIPVMAKCRIGHFVEAQILEAIEIDYIDESEVLSPADNVYHIDKHQFKVPFVCGAKDLGEALRRINEGASMIRTKGEPGTGDVVQAVTHMRKMNQQIAQLVAMRDDELFEAAKTPVSYTHLGAFFTVSGGITIGQLSVFLNYASQYAKPFNEISSVVTELQNAISCAERIFDILEEADQVPEKDPAISPECKGEVELDHVAFRYVPDRPLIKDLNLKVNSGERVAIVGPTGCGKTTIINLLMRFYDVDSGEIRVDGADIRDMTRHDLRGRYGMVLQDTWLCTGTVRENIAYGKPDATEEEVIEAAKAAHADSFIRRLPKGYDTMITGGGGNLSAGQRQLLCIARAMLCLPMMLILDEATSSIDTRTEMKIQSAFAKMMKGRTSFIVAHRLSTIREADVILVMKDGSIIEQGNHKELLAAGGFYANLYNSQFVTVQS